MDTIRGSIAAVITPFRNGAVSYSDLEKMIEYLLAGGIDGIVACGSTGESSTLNHKEHLEVIDFTVKKVKGKVPVIAGTGSNSTDEAIELARGAKKSGADAHLSVAPYYNKPTQEGIYQHFKAVAGAVDLPMIMYNIPGRTGVNMLPETIGRLSKIKNIDGVKEASGNLQQAAEIIEYSRPGFLLFSGEDGLNLPILSVGGAGAISVTANIVPKLCGELFKSYFKGDVENAKNVHISLMPLHRAMFLETNPIPVKTAAFMMGLIDNLEFRLPLCRMNTENSEKLKTVLREKGLI